MRAAVLGRVDDDPRCNNSGGTAAEYGGRPEKANVINAKNDGAYKCQKKSDRVERVRQ